MNLEEFSFDRVEELESLEAASLLHKLSNVGHERSMAWVTIIDFEKWGEYLGDPGLAMIFLAKVLDRAAIRRIYGKSYRAHQVERASVSKRSKKENAVRAEVQQQLPTPAFTVFTAS